MDLLSILKDKEFMEEITDRIEKGAFTSTFPIVDRKSTIDLLKNINESNVRAIQLSAIEAIVLEIARPALIIKNGQFELPESDTWKTYLQKHKLVIEAAISSVGRIELKNHSQHAWGGTGWLVHENIIVTNRHVAQLFSKKDINGSFTFLRNFENKQIGALIDFKEEYFQPDEAEFKVIKVLYIEEDTGPDIAFLEIEPTKKSCNPILLSNNINPDANVAVIGYPAWDGLRNDPDIMQQIFHGIFGVKRLQPGKIITVQNDYLTHDCSTLGGNSGSPIIDISTGQAIGMHFAGFYSKENYAVPAYLIKDRLDLLRK